MMMVVVMMKVDDDDNGSKFVELSHGNWFDVEPNTWESEALRDTN